MIFAVSCTLRFCFLLVKWSFDQTSLDRISLPSSPLLPPSPAPLMESEVTSSYPLPESPHCWPSFPTMHYHCSHPPNTHTHTHHTHTHTHTHACIYTQELSFMGINPTLASEGENPHHPFPETLQCCEMPAEEAGMCWWWYTMPVLFWQQKNYWTVKAWNQNI